ncbi:MAG: rhodanese-like domain-containing protein [Campylobacterota bacterium]|nr:rhodanese-like domain-containing protein [Campylobacterota bacterium]
MKLGNILLATILLAGVTYAQEFIDYKQLSKQLKAESKKAGNTANAADIKNCIADKKCAVVDVRTKEEWNAAHIKGTSRIGRQAPEKALANVVLDDDDNFIKNKIIVVCNTSSRASIDAEKFRKMGFSKVKIYSINSWIDQCNPVTNKYSKAKDKHGTKIKFGMFKAEHCYK